MNNKLNEKASNRNKFRLISEFVEESARITKNSHHRHQFISEVRRSREIITVEPDIENMNEFDNQDSTNYRQGIQPEFKQKPNKFMTSSFNLKESFVKAEMDDTTYESLMHEFMGSYLEQRLSSKQTRQPSFNHQCFQTENKFKETSNYIAPIVNKNEQSPINKESQITFSGSKQSRIINENQQSRIVKDQYFLLDQLKNSQNSKKSQSRDKKAYQRSNETFDKNKYIVEQSYRLKSSTSPERLRQSLRQSRQAQRENSQSKLFKLSNQKIKVQKINLVKESSSRSKSKSKSKKQSKQSKPFQKYNISKQQSTNKKKQDTSHIANQSHSRRSHRQQPIVIEVTLVDEDNQQAHKQFQKSRATEKSPQKRSGQVSSSKQIKKISVTNNLKMHKTFNSSSKSKKFEVNNITQQKTSLINMLDLNKSRKQTTPQKPSLLTYTQPFKIAKDKPTVNEQKQQPTVQPQNTLNNIKKYNYEYTYNMNEVRFPKQESSIINLSQKSSQTDSKGQNGQEVNIQKDRQMIRQIKKDLTKLIHKISSTPIKNS